MQKIALSTINKMCTLKFTCSYVYYVEQLEPAERDV